MQKKNVCQPLPPGIVPFFLLLKDVIHTPDIPASNKTLN